METVFNWITENTNYTPVLHDKEIDHKQIQATLNKKGYIPRHKKYTVTLLQDIPTRSGVYLFFDKHDRLIYVGKASGLRDRIRQHVQGNGNTTAIKEKFYRIAYIRCIEYDAKEIERIIIETFKPYGNIRGVTK